MCGIYAVVSTCHSISKWRRLLRCLAIACEVVPHTVTLVPEGRQELTTEGGLRIFDQSLHEMIATLRAKGIAVSLFVEPDRKAVAAACQAGATAVELHVGEVCAALHKKSCTAAASVRACPTRCRRGTGGGAWEVHIGHGIDYEVAEHFACLDKVSEADIGHAIIAEAVFVGMYAAVKRMKELIG